MVAVKQRMLEDTSWWFSEQGNLVQKHYYSPSLHILGAQKLATSHPTVILLKSSSAMCCNVLLLVWGELYEILRQSEPGIHHIAHPPALNPFSFQWKAGSMVGRREKRGQKITHPGCILTNKQHVTAVHIWASKLENSPRPHSLDAPLHLTSCFKQEITLWLAMKSK